MKRGNFTKMMKIGLPLFITDVSSQKIREKSKNPEFLLDAVINLITEMEVDKFLSLLHEEERSL